MKVQIPAEGILKRSDYGDAKSYQISCECHQPDHEHNVWVEADDSAITVTIYTTAKSKWWSTNRWKQMWSLVTKGYIEYEADIIMTKQQALNYAETLKSAVADVEEFRAIKKQMGDLQNKIASRLAEQGDCA